MNSVRGRVRLDRTIITGWALTLVGTAISLSGAFIMMQRSLGVAGQLTLFFTVFIIGFSMTMLGVAIMKKRGDALPKEEFHQPLALRRLVVVAANVVVLAANIPWLLAPMPWNVTGFVFLYICSVAMLAIFLMPYQIWVFGPVKGLDEYHLNRRLRARDLAYTGLAMATVLVLGICALLQWSPPVFLPMAAFFYLWQLLSLPCMVLAWTEPDQD